ncbi:hypothetical protein ACGFWI_37895 [Streptomyces sp. NPDC048434]|uniref:hypothetical protein n=1 Tax=Streptomyces sp. NPDC048434 TaxID=3365549 RepID=UPI0037197EDC
MSKSNPFKARQDRRNAEQGATAGPATVPGQATESSDAPSDVSGGANGQAVVTFAQGRAEKMLGFEDLPDPVETPEATGDLSSEEEGILALCMQAFKQFENAWWVTAKGMANVNARRLYRRTHPTFEAFAQDVFNKSKPLAYEEMASYPIGELLSARADIPVIGKKVAGALNRITTDYGAAVSVAVHETIKDATGKSVPVKTITGVVQQIPRKEDKELTQDELTALARELVTKQQGSGSGGQQRTREGGAAGSETPALDALRVAVSELESAHRALAPAKIEKAFAESSVETTKLLAEAARTARKAVSRADAPLGHAK